MRIDSQDKLLASFLLFTVWMWMPLTAAGEDSPTSVFGEVIDVRVFNLEVAVTGKDGQHIPDLGPRDFRLIVDGQPVPIEYFSEIRQGSAMTRPEIEAGDTTTNARVAAVPSVAPGELVGTSFLLFVDNYFSLARDRQVVLENIIEDLPNLGPADRMAVVSFDGQRLDLVGTWATAPEKIADNLRQALAQPTRGLQRKAELSLYTLELKSGAGLISERDFNTQVEYIRKLSGQVEKAAKAATAALRSMASPDGRKVMLLTSGGWPGEPSIFAAGLNPEIRNATQRFSPKQAFNDLASTANLLGYSIFPIDTPGRQIHQRGADNNGEDLAVFSPPLDTGGGGPAGAPSLAPPPSREDLTIREMDRSIAAFDATAGREQIVEAPLIELAKETGGRAMLNSFRGAALSRTLEDTKSYYWLGYSPLRAHDDKEHKVKVEVLRKGLKSRSRQGFRDLSRQAEVTMMVESNLLFSTDLQGPSLAVDLGAPSRVKRGKLELPVSLTIPLDQIIMLPNAQGFQAELELRVAVLDDKGDRSEIPVIPVSLGGADKPPPGAHAIYDTSLILRNIPQRVALALYDLAGEGILSTSIDFDPGATH